VVTGPQAVFLVDLFPGGGPIHGLPGIPLGLYQAAKRCTTGDYVLTGVSFLGYATPTFFVALLLVQWFSIDIPLFPPFAPQGCTRCGAGTCARRSWTTSSRTTSAPHGPRAPANAGCYGATCSAADVAYAVLGPRVRYD
jgi:hypothetical protein